ncbi:hypothetical protein NDU88_007589 [Pleurodeles waltl]|uniref:Uncharacterized protein n=1 Tax=Pleurodeles waltl TaxID=8319 RepID=A0AAV7NYE4_PLEWA|nr:hypothetical protein NDU88_007589 [Pleurodeles waltl]
MAHTRAVLDFAHAYLACWPAEIGGAFLTLSAVGGAFGENRLIQVAKRYVRTGHNRESGSYAVVVSHSFGKEQFWGVENVCEFEEFERSDLG